MATGDGLYEAARRRYQAQLSLGQRQAQMGHIYGVGLAGVKLRENASRTYSGVKLRENAERGLCRKE